MTVEILPANELTDIKRALASLVMCRHADEIELEDAAWCRTCNFKPAIDPGVPDARRRIDDLEDQLDTLNRSWATFIAKALEDPMAERACAPDEAEAAAVKDIADPDTGAGGAGCPKTQQRAAGTPARIHHGGRSARRPPQRRSGHRAGPRGSPRHVPGPGDGRQEPCYGPPGDRMTRATGARTACSCAPSSWS